MQRNFSLFRIESNSVLLIRHRPVLRHDTWHNSRIFFLPPKRLWGNFFSRPRVCLIRSAKLVTRVHTWRWNIQAAHAIASFLTFALTRGPLSYQSPPSFAFSEQICSRISRSVPGRLIGDDCLIFRDGLSCASSFRGTRSRVHLVTNAYRTPRKRLSVSLCSLEDRRNLVFP